MLHTGLRFVRPRDKIACHQRIINALRYRSSTNGLYERRKSEALGAALLQDRPSSSLTTPVDPLDVLAQSDDFVQGPPAHMSSSGYAKLTEGVDHSYPDFVTNITSTFDLAEKPIYDGRPTNAIVPAVPLSTILDTSAEFPKGTSALGVTDMQSSLLPARPASPAPEHSIALSWSSVWSRIFDSRSTCQTTNGYW